jgi:hypothetical protein
MRPVGFVAATRRRPSGRPRRDAVEALAETCRRSGLPRQQAVEAVAESRWNRLRLAAKASGQGLEPRRAAKGNGAAKREGVR